jgi:hypothetical protein
MVTEDPKLFNPGAAGDGFDEVNEFRIILGSSAIDMGLKINGTTVVDLAGNPVPLNAATDIGAFEYSGPVGLGSVDFVSFGDLGLYPNPVKGVAQLRINSRQHGTVEVSIYDARMCLLKVVSEAKMTEVHQMELDLTLLPEGLYFVKVQLAESQIVKKIIKL